MIQVYHRVHYDVSYFMKRSAHHGLVQPKCLSFNNGIYSFRYEGARLWNLLEPHL